MYATISGIVEVAAVLPVSVNFDTHSSPTVQDAYAIRASV